MMYSRNHEIRFSLLIRPSVKKDRNAIGYIDGQVGRYKGGVQHVNPSDLSAGKRKKRKWIFPCHVWFTTLFLRCAKDMSIPMLFLISNEIFVELRKMQLLHWFLSGFIARLTIYLIKNKIIINNLIRDVFNIYRQYKRRGSGASPGTSFLTRSRVLRV